MALHENRKTDDEWIVGKQEMATLLGWSRPTLDLRLQSDAKFPVRRRGNQSGGWQFSVLEVFEHMGCEPPPRPGRLQLNDRDTAAALMPLLPLGLPAVPAPPRANLSEGQKGTVVSIIEAHNGRGRPKIGATLKSMFAAVDAAIAAQIAKVPGSSMPADQGRSFVESQVRMVGALVDIVEARVFQMSDGPKALESARRWFDGLRTELAEGFRENFAIT